MLATLVAGVAALVFPRFEGGNTTVMGLATEALTYGLVTMSLNLLMGYGGQVSVGQAGFLAVGAYVTAIVATHVGGLPFIVVLALAGLVTAAVGLVLGLPAAGCAATTSPSPPWASAWPCPRSRSTAAV